MQNSASILMPDLYPEDGPRRTFIASNTILALLATLFVIARMIAKRMRKLGYTWDDALLGVGLLFLYISVAVAVTSSVVGHLGQHIDTASPEKLRLTLILLWAIQFPHAIAMTAIRCSILILFLRLFFTVMFPKLRWLDHAGIVLAVGWFLSIVVVNLVHCRPLRYNWSLPLEDATFCFPLKPFAYATAGWGLVLDAVTWSMPHYVVWTLQLRLAHKIAITGIFALGLVIIVVGVFRINALSDVTFGGDVTYDALRAVVWTIAHLSTSVILACCPILRPLFEKLIPTRLTRISPASIKVTTRITVQPESSRLWSHHCFHSDLEEQNHGPTFEVDRPAYRHGCSCLMC